MGELNATKVRMTGGRAASRGKFIPPSSWLEISSESLPTPPYPRNKNLSSRRSVVNECARIEKISQRRRRRRRKKKKRKEIVG